MSEIKLSQGNKSEMLPSTMQELAETIHDAVYKQFFDYKITIFLCGAGAQVEYSVRSIIDHELTHKWFSYRYDLFYPEDLFDALLIGPSHQDLISLENILADSVDAVVLVIESWGAVAELGSFASNDNLRKKIVCVVDQKYRADKSFINFGPLRLIRDTKEGEIVYIDFENVGDNIDLIRTAINRIKKRTSKSTGVGNVVQAHHFILSCIYLLEPIPHHLLVNLVEHASSGDERTAEALTAGALSMLTKNKEVEITPDGYGLTPSGARAFRELGKRGSTRYAFDLKAMDSIRVDVLNWRLRNKRLRHT